MASWGGLARRNPPLLPSVTSSAPLAEYPLSSLSPAHPGQKLNDSSADDESITNASIAMRGFGESQQQLRAISLCDRRTKFGGGPAD
jgi:hypothetical protein